MNRFGKVVVVLATFVGASASAHAGIIVTDYWSLAGGSGFDSVGGVNLNTFGAGYYSSSSTVPSTTTTPVLPGTTTNFGMEIEAIATGYANATVFYNGSDNASGWGISEVCNANCTAATWNVLYGGTVVGSGAPVSLDHSVELTLVDISNVTSFYVNGVSVSLSFAPASAPNATNGALTIGFNGNNSGPLADPGQHFVGTLADASVFTVTNGQFSLLDLAPEPSSMALMGLGLIGLAVCARKWRTN